MPRSSSSAEACHAEGVQLEVVGDVLEVDLGWRDGLLALRRRLSVPVRSVRGVAAAPSASVPRTGLRFPGTGAPGVRIGSFGFGAQRDFWCVRRASQLLVVELEPGEPYRRLVLEVDDPHGEALRLRPVLGAWTGTFR